MKTMYEFIQSGELKTQTKRLLGYRMTLVLVIIVNIILILRIAMPQARQALARSPASDAWAESGARIDAPSTAQASSPPLSVSADESANLPRHETRLDPIPQADDQPSSDVRRARKATLQVELAGGIATPLDQSPPATNMDRAGAEILPSDNPLATNALATTMAVLPTIPLAAWQHDAQQLVKRWQHAAQSILSQHRTRQKSAISARSIEKGLAVRSSERLPTDHPSASAGEPNEQELSNQQAEEVRDEAGLKLYNPLENAEPIRFLVNHHLCELQPGESHQFPPSDPWLIQFHPGGAFEDVERVVTEGVYRFVITQQGWDLVPFKTETN